MRLLAIVLSFAVTAGTCAQQSPPDLRPEPATVPVFASVPPQTKTITVPAGTKIPVTLTNTISTSSTKAGDAIRVVTAFPVTVETQLAIPPGVYVEGSIDKISKRKSVNQDVLRMHFTRLVFPSGYQVALEKATAIARATEKKKGANESAALPQHNIPGAMSFQQPPPLPPLPHHGVPAVFVGVAVGTAAIVVVAVLVGRHRGHDVVFDVGSQFDLLLQKPLTLETAKIAAMAPNAD